MDDDVKAVLSELCQAINDGLSSSERVNDSVKKLEALGFQFAIYLEATLLLNRTEEGKPRKGKRTARRVRTGALKLSEQDVKCLRSLKIALRDGAR